MELDSFIEKSKNRMTEVEKEMSEFDFNAPGSNHAEYEKITREYQRLKQVLALWEEYQQIKSTIVENQEMLETEEEEELREMIETELPGLEEKERKLGKRLKALVLPPLPHEGRNIIVEIRPAAGGDEAGLFAGDLFKMYTRFAEQKGWKRELLEYAESEIGGLKNAAFSLEAEDAYKLMRFESGVHRVQRIPVTESGGRIHTSTVTVAVLPEPEEVELHIDPNELRVDVFRASGPGGQSVNTTDSAVRITHLPTGITVSAQQEKSQHRNREIGMRILRSRVLERLQEEENAKSANARKEQVGTGDRSERIRTYNFPQNRISDHRYNITRYDLDTVLAGELQSLLDELLVCETERRLQRLVEENA